MKYAPILVLVLIIAGGLYWFTTQNTEAPTVVDVSTSTPQAEEADGKIGADVFTGTLQEVDEGCYADGECFVVVDGKHVTVIMGWSQETVGSVQGVASFGDLNAHIGGQVEVYAAKKDGAYTLYGSEGFYVKVK